MNPLRWLALILCAALGVGCDPTPVLYKTIAIAAPVVAGGYRSLDAADQMEQAKVRARAQGGDTAGAKQELAAHLKKYDIAAISLDTTMATMQTAVDSAPALKAAHDKKATLELVATLFTLYADLKAALAPFGVDISIPGVQ